MVHECDVAIRTAAPCCGERSLPSFLTLTTLAGDPEGQE